jgi:hypothetical protein
MSLKILKKKISILGSDYILLLYLINGSELQGDALPKNYKAPSVGEKQINVLYTA